MSIPGLLQAATIYQAPSPRRDARGDVSGRSSGICLHWTRSRAARVLGQPSPILPLRPRSIGSTSRRPCWWARSIEQTASWGWPMPAHDITPAGRNGRRLRLCALPVSRPRRLPRHSDNERCAFSRGIGRAMSRCARYSSHCWPSAGHWRALPRSWPRRNHGERRLREAKCSLNRSVPASPAAVPFITSQDDRGVRAPVYPFRDGSRRASCRYTAGLRHPFAPPSRQIGGFIVRDANPPLTSSPASLQNGTSNDNGGAWCAVAPPVHCN
jgi:hypothetical protein